MAHGSPGLCVPSVRGRVEGRSVVSDPGAVWRCEHRAQPFRSTGEPQDFVPDSVTHYIFGDQRCLTSHCPRAQAEQTDTCLPTSPSQWCAMVLNSWFYSSPQTCRAVSPSKSPACFPSEGKLLLFMAVARFSLGRVVLLSLQ